MSKYKVGDKVVMEIGKYEGFYGISDNENSDITFWFRDDHLDRCTEPLPAYTEPLEAKIRRQAAEITRLLEENMRLKPNYENIRAKGQNEAWKLAKKIVGDVRDSGYSAEELGQIFGYAISQPCIMENTYQKAAAKVAEWEKAKEEIKVGDEVKHNKTEYTGIVTRVSERMNKITIIFKDGSSESYDSSMFHKTGRHIDIDSFLKQIGEE